MMIIDKKRIGTTPKGPLYKLTVVGDKYKELQVFVNTKLDEKAYYVARTYRDKSGKLSYISKISRDYDTKEEALKYREKILNVSDDKDFYYTCNGYISKYDSFYADTIWL